MPFCFRTEEPIARDPETDTPIVVPALTAELHLEPLSPADEAALASACAAALDWVGGSLRWTVMSAFPWIEPFRPRDLDYVPGFTRLLPTGLEKLPSELHEAAYGAHAAMAQDYSIDCHGGAGPIHASAFQVRFFATAADDAEPGELVVSRAMLRVSVPATWPLEDFRARVAALAGLVPLRWGNAGLGYGTWECCWYDETRRTVFAHARRHPGFDMGQYASLMEEWHGVVRTVSWLTLLGPSMRKELEARSGVRLEATDLVRVEALPGGVTILQAGAEPEAGDTNRRDIPRAYVHADALVRPIRARGMDFHGPWGRERTAEWLSRFERVD